MGTRRRFSREFKVDAVKLVCERGVTVSQASRDLDIHVNVLRGWVRAHREDPSHAYKTRIVSDLPLQTTETANWDDSEGAPRRYVRARQTVGQGGGVIRVRTVNGNIVINRGR